MSLIDSLQKIEAAALGNDRLAAIRDNDSPELRQYFYLALSPDVTFGVRKVDPDSDGPSQYKDDEQWWAALVQLAIDLSEDGTGNRKLTGNAAKRAVSEMLYKCGPLQYKWASRMILQDTRLSVGAKEINKLFGPSTIPLFAVPLAEQYKKLKSRVGIWYLQPKLDGGRCVARISGGKVTLLSRTGKEWKGFQEIKNEVLALYGQLNTTQDISFDGEIVVYKNGRMDFQAMQRLFFAQDGRAPEGDLKYVIFDMARGTEYDDPKTTYEKRLCDLVSTFGLAASRQATYTHIQLVEYLLVTSPSEDVLNSLAVKYVAEQGCDGLIMRRADSVPKNKRTSDITKVKPFEDAEATVVDRVEGKGWLEGSLGTMVCKMPSGVVFEIGTGEGLTKELRQELWDDKYLIGSTVNFKYQRLSDDGVPVLPTFRAIRHPNDYERAAS